MKYKYILRHKKNNVYLQFVKRLNFNHYTSYEEATRFDYNQARYRLNKFKHPENWELKKVRINDED